jgi:hypothetical protein
VASKAAVFGILAAGQLIRFCGRVFDMMMALITASRAVASKNALRKGFSEGCAIRTGMAAARPPTASRDEGWTESCAPSEARSLRQPEDELPADGTKLLERVGAWLKQRARMKPAGKSFFNGTSWIGL